MIRSQKKFHQLTIDAVRDSLPNLQCLAVQHRCGILLLHQGYPALLVQMVCHNDVEVVELVHEVHCVGRIYDRVTFH